MARGQSVKTLLFDLDGTLIKLNMELFLPRYFHALGEHCSTLIDPESLVKLIWKSTEAMVTSSDPTVTNQQVFELDFLERSGLTAAEVLPMFDSFYADVFPQLAGEEIQSSATQEALELSLQKGLEVVVATNPVFPLSAIRQRLIWGGFRDVPFKLITAYENMHFCKPRREYYQEVLHVLGRKPEECWMIGNDVNEDMIAGELGLNTFLVEDYLIPGSAKVVPTRSGRMEDLPKFVASVIA